MKPLLRKCCALGLLMGMGLSGSAQAWEAGDWLVRLRGLHIDPSADSDPINAPALGGAVPGSEVDVDTSTVPELDITYMWTKHIGTELVLAVSENTISAAGTASDLGDVADVWLLPPSLTVQYHFLPDSRFSPYIGAGVNWTVFFSEDLDSNFSNPGDSIDLENSFSYVFQAGFDVKLDNDWFINLDVKYIDLNTEATIRNSSAGDIFVDDVDIDPWTFGFGIGKRF